MDDTAIMRAVPRTGPAPRREGARPKLPLPALVLVVGVIACGVAAIAIRIPEVMAWTPRDLWAYLGLAGAISVVELFPLRFRHATEVQYLSLTDALWAAGMLLLLTPNGIVESPRPGVLTMAVGVGALVGQAVQRRDALKSAFNIGQWLLGITVAETLFRAAGPSPVAHPQAWLAAPAGGRCARPVWPCPVPSTAVSTCVRSCRSPGGSWRRRPRRSWWSAGTPWPSTRRREPSRSWPVRGMDRSGPRPTSASATACRHRWPWWAARTTSGGSWPCTAASRCQKRTARCST